MGREVEEGGGRPEAERYDPAAPREQFRRYRRRRSKDPPAIVGGSPSLAGASEGLGTPSLSLRDMRDSFVAMSPPSVSRQSWMHSSFPGEYRTPVASGARGLRDPRAELLSSPMSFDDDEEQPHWMGGYGDEGEDEDERMELKPPVLSKTPVVLRKVKPEPGLGEEMPDSAEQSYGRFALMTNAALQDEISLPDFLEQCEVLCHDLAQVVREEASEGHRVTEERLMRQTAQMLHAESGTWSLLWYLFGKEAQEMYSDDPLVYPATSTQEAVQFIMSEPFVQQCMRIVQWLESMASKDLDYQKKHKGWYAGSYMQKLGVWHQTQREIRKRAGQATLVRNVDPDAPTREHARLHPEDQKLEEDLMEDVWKLLRAGRLGEARELCRSAGQPWRAASLGGCGELGSSPSVEAFCNAGKDRALQALELESGIGHQRRLWKWACYIASEKIGDRGDEAKHEAAVYASQCGNVRRMLPVCIDWESACWAMARSWLDTQVDAELSQRHPPKVPKRRTTGAVVRTSAKSGGSDASMEVSEEPHSWPQPVVDQQPRDFVGMFDKLRNADLVHAKVKHSCNEQQRLVQMDLIMGNFSHLLDLLKDWTIPKDTTIKFHGHPQIVRFGSHLVLVLRRILADTSDEVVAEKLRIVGDLILNGYVIFLFTEHQEDLVGVYASQLAPHLCVDLYVNFMDLRLNDPVPVKYKLFRSAIEFLPFFPDIDETKGCVLNILEKVLSKSREIKPGLQAGVKSEELERGGIGELRQLQSVQKAQALQWLCFTPPETVPGVERIRAELLARALEHSNLLFREFALLSLWRTTVVPAGPHRLLSLLAEPLKQVPEILASLEHPDRMEENLQEFECWRFYYECDGLYRSWFNIEQTNAEVPPEHLSVEEKERAISAARVALEQAFALLTCDNGMWLAGVDTTVGADTEVAWLELQATAVLMSASGVYLPPEPTVCTTLSSALHHCGGEAGLMRQLTVEVDVNRRDINCVDVRLRCLPVSGDGLGLATGHDGGLLGSILALAAKGEMPHFQSGLALEVVSMDAWRWDENLVLRTPATYILQGLARRCCLPELILRCMELKVFLAASRGAEDVDDESTDLIGLVASKETALHRLFSQRQLQIFLLLERNMTICRMESCRDHAPHF